jgi:hypothetical protein
MELTPAMIRAVRAAYIWGPREHTRAVAEIAAKFSLDPAAVEHVVSTPGEPDERRGPKKGTPSPIKGRKQSPEHLARKVAALNRTVQQRQMRQRFENSLLAGRADARGDI